MFCTGTRAALASATKPAMLIGGEGVAVSGKSRARLRCAAGLPILNLQM